MVGTTLVDIREHVDALAVEDGDYHVVCARTGTRPVPAEGKRFPDRSSARAAARATEQYRAALRRYDPRVPYHDVIACEVAGDGRGGPSHRACTADPAWTLSPPVVGGRPDGDRSHPRVSFCHDVAAAVFEALSAGDHDAVERGVMDAYFEHAEQLPDPDDLCLCLLESMAVELDRELPPRTQAVVLADAAARLGPIEDGEDPVRGTLERFEHLGLVDRFSRSAWSADGDDRRVIEIGLGAYALSPHDGQLPVLPVVLSLFRRSFEGPLTEVTATATADGWRLHLAVGGRERPTGLACTPIEGVG